MKYKIPVYQPSLDGNEKKYLLECLESTWISSKGRFINSFESEFAKYIGIKSASSVCNGTIALHLALLALGLKNNDEVIVPSFTYIASVNAISYVGATPVFVDILPHNWQLDPDDVIKKITPRTRAIMPVHLYGHPADMYRITEIAKENNLYLIEDCAEAFGSKINNKHVGTFGDISTFSFFGNKTITTGEGGMVVTDNEELFSRIQKLKNQGNSINQEYWQDIIGHNFRMTNMAAAIGLAQLERADIILKKKRDIANLYKNELAGLPIKFQEEYDNVEHSYWMFNILVENSTVRKKLREYLKNKLIETRPTFYPVHTMSMYSSQKQSLPISEDIGLRGITLPSYPDLSMDEINYICINIRAFYENV
ncbi:MAG: DegT/DnrJ/EryC1/StrS family aminotransferase [Arcobacter sp.]|nr:DegT/DnrJ/EryC1/StrS family aminotransferase [Arcobacter sp.]